jgi:membrane protein
MRLPRHVENSARLIGRAATYWSSDNASTAGAALAFYCAFSLAPLLVIISAVAGAVIGTAAAYGQIGSQLNDLFGPATAKILLGAVKSSQQAQGVLATWVSAVTLIVSATTVFSALESSLEIIWQDTTPATRGIRGWIRRRVLSVGFILALGFLLLVSLTVTTCLATLRAQVAQNHAAVVGMIGGLDLLISAASFAALLLWLYYTAQIFLFGAEFTAVLGGLRKS